MDNPDTLPDTGRKPGMINRLIAERYEILEIIGENTLFGAYRSRDRAVNRTVALKVVTPEYGTRADIAERLRAGLSHVMALTHPNIARLMDVGVDNENNGGMFFVEEYVRGIDLKERIRRIAPLSLTAATDIAIHIAEALEYTHGRGVPHGDIRPQNVIIGAENQCKLFGFGVAVAYPLLDPHTEIARQVNAYLPPECVRLPAPNTQNDIYSIGVILFEMLTGNLPYTETGENTKGNATLVPSPRSVNRGVPPALEGIIQKAMHREPQRRYQHVSTLLTDLRTVREALRYGRPLNWIPAEENISVAPLTAPVAEVPVVTLAQGERPSDPLPIVSSSVPPPPVEETPHEHELIAPNAPRREGRTQTTPVAQEERILSEKKDKGQRRSGGAGWILAINLFLVLLILGGVGALLWLARDYTLPLKDVVVPNLVGKSVDEAKSIAETNSFRLGIVERINRDSEPSGIIFQMKPQPGHHIREGRAVEIWVSKGPKMVSVPDVRGMTSESARRTLEKSGLRMGRFDGEFDLLVAKGNVLRQSPSPSDEIPRGTRVDLVISKGEEPPPPPDPIETTDTGETVNTGTDGEDRVFEIRYPVPADNQPHRIRIDVTDTNGSRTVFEETTDPGQKLKHEVRGVGTGITIRLYDNDTLRHEQTQ